tara:strand:- start:55 stop:366 length:312 start_codon:yes stop_codon:yes gene_type:complete
MNYLDLLNDDLMEKVIGYVTESVENDLTKTTTNVNKLKNKLKHLKIDRSYLDDENRQYLSIDLDNKQMNHLTNLNDDILNNILNFITDKYENDIKIVEKKIKT